MCLASCLDGLLEFEVDVGSGWCGLKDLNAGRGLLMLVDTGGCWLILAVVSCC